MRKTRPRVKICCISSVEEAKTAIEYGASALGLVGPMPSGPGIIEIGLIKQIATAVPPSVSTILLINETKADKIIEQYNKTHTTAIQLVDTIEEQQYAIIRKELPHVKLIQVVHVMDHHSVRKAINLSKSADAILLDSGNPNLPIKELGGTGRTHNWELSREIRKSIKIPLFLAGGLNKSNVKQAIKLVQPFGVDLCSGVRTADKLDKQKLKAFFSVLNS